MKQKSYSSTLTEVPGVGPKTAKALLTQFKSVGAVKDATPDQLENTPGVGKQLAQTIYEYFHGKTPPASVFVSFGCRGCSAFRGQFA
jgi:excinuclease ABC subunit C